MAKPRKNINVDLKTHETLRKIAFKNKITISQLIRNLLELSKTV